MGIAIHYEVKALTTSQLETLVKEVSDIAHSAGVPYSIISERGTFSLRPRAECSYKFIADKLGLSAYCERGPVVVIRGRPARRLASLPPEERLRELRRYLLANVLVYERAEFCPFSEYVPVRFEGERLARLVRFPIPFESEARGVAVHAPAAETLSFEFVKSPITRKWHQLFGYASAKTQPFEPSEFEASVRAHVLYCAILKRLERLGFIKYVKDEGKFYESGDVEGLVEIFATMAALICGTASLFSKLGVDTEVKAVFPTGEKYLTTIFPR